MKKVFVMGLLSAVLGLLGCDQAAIDKLEEGVSTEADVKRELGEPLTVFDDGNGVRTLEYPRQPEGHRNYMITIGADGKMTALRQVLTPVYFAKVQSGLGKEEVRRILGRPAKVVPYELKKETEWEWKFMDGTQAKLFVVTFNSLGQVVKTAELIEPSPNAPAGK
jgi:outer membrane protein assembly factor BamE (lipoprotein component of BamABCDE complex)